MEWSIFATVRDAMAEAWRERRMQLAPHSPKRRRRRPPPATIDGVNAVVLAVSRSASHTMAKANQTCIRLVEGLGVESDAHAGKTVKHRSRVARDPMQPNLRQVHLVQAELFDELRASGFDISPGRMGENITTAGVDLLALATGTRLHIGDAAVVEITGLRNPCRQLDKIRPGLMSAVLDRDAAGNLIRKAGIMGVVLKGGEIRPGDTIHVEPPPEPHRPLECV
jgi:MOSC domain-containing protein YiiM